MKKTLDQIKHIAQVALYILIAVGLGIFTYPYVMNVDKVEAQECGLLTTEEFIAQKAAALENDPKWRAERERLSLEIAIDQINHEGNLTRARISEQRDAEIKEKLEVTNY